MIYLECGCHILPMYQAPAMGEYRFCAAHGKLQRVVYVSAMKVAGARLGSSG